MPHHRGGGAAPSVGALVTPHLSVAAAARAGSGEEAHGAYRAGLGLADDQLGAWVHALIADAREDRPRGGGYVPSTHLWWVRGQTYLGRVEIRHRLTEPLREVGGHIGYFVVPAHRRRGHAGAMLAAALPVAASLGIECALVTCDATNVASRKTIEANGGLYCDQRGVKLRYWVPTHRV